ncbi:MAG: hypoxanthine phosphoribosyltransferase [Clostridia bacterium]|nr:hypoxanthine phosphoribosyltransferase [Clostridia bacterium]
MVKYKTVLTAKQIKKRVKEIGKQISKDYEGKEPVIICMLKGAVYFFADLTKNISIPIKIDFARLSSYRNGTTSGVMEIISNITSNIENKDIIIVEDIVDSGKTLAYFIKLMKEKNPSSIRICAFLDKKERREVDIKVDYVGFDIPCGFVIGYGMDYAEKFRELPYLAEIINPEELDK